MGTRRLTSLSSMLAAICLLLPAVAHASSPTWTVSTIAPLSGDVSTEALGVNNYGEAVGYSEGSSGSHAISYAANGGVVDLSAVTGDELEQANSVNDNGEIVGVMNVPGAGMTGFAYTPGVGLVNLGAPAGSAFFIPLAVNNSGVIVGYTGTYPNGPLEGAPGTRTAFEYDPSSGWVDIGALPGAVPSGTEPAPQSVATAINTSGEVAGWSDSPSGHPHSFSYTLSGGIEDLGGIPGACGNYGGDNANFAAAISDLGEIVGYGFNSSCTNAAFAYTPATGMAALPEAGVGFMYGTAVNNAGLVGGEFGDPSTAHPVPFIYTPGSGTTELPMTAGYEAGYVTAISNSGEIVGYGSTEASNSYWEAQIWQTQQPQTISFPPTTVTYGQADFSPATASSGLTVTYAVQSGPCTVDAQGLLQISGAGSCSVTASQAGDSDYSAATPVTQTVTIMKAPQTITFNPPTSVAGTVGGSSTVSASGGSSGNPVLFSIDPASTNGACTLSGATVSYTGVGTCVVDANQVGSADYSPAPTAQQTYSIGYGTANGFMAPISNAPTVNTGRAGRTYPVKWQLLDASGSTTGSLSSISAVTYQATQCAAFTSDPTNALTATTTGGTSLSFDGSTFHYNWQTPSSAGCYTLFAELNSGQLIYAYFQLS